MRNIRDLVRLVRDILCKKLRPGLSDDAQHIGQLGRMVFLKLVDGKEIWQGENYGYHVNVVS